MLIKEFVTKPLREHDTDYPWYRPGNIPANTCSYPYEFAYPRAYPTYTVTQTAHLQTCTCLSCLKNKHSSESKEQSQNGNADADADAKSNWWFNVFWIVFLVLLGVFISSLLSRWIIDWYYKGKGNDLYQSKPSSKKSLVDVQ